MTRDIQRRMNLTDEAVRADDLNWYDVDTAIWDERAAWENEISRLRKTIGMLVDGVDGFNGCDLHELALEIFEDRGGDSDSSSPTLEDYVDAAVRAAVNEEN